MNLDIFISYSRYDSDQVNELVALLEQEGYSIWIDRDGIESGEDFKRVILKAIKESKVILFFSSEHSNVSDWTAKEIGVAVKYKKHIIPIKLDDSNFNEAVEFDLINLDYIDYSKLSIQSAMRDKLLKTLRNKIGNGSKELERLEAERKAKEEAERARIERERLERIEAERKAEEAKRKAEQERLERERAEARRSAKKTNIHDVNCTAKRLSKKGVWIGIGVIILAVVLIILLLPGSKEQSSLKVKRENSDLVLRYENLIYDYSYKMKFVEGGIFQMGSSDKDAFDNEQPVHSVMIDSYYMGETEVTQLLWDAVMNDNPSITKGNRFPVEMVSWNDVQEFICKLNILTGKNFRLPTEAEWEFAARGGLKSKGFKYSGSDNLDEVAWYGDNSNGSTHLVGEKKSNELGLYDMSGNVWEWCNDLYGAYSSESQINPTGPSSLSHGLGRVLRGGGRYGNASGCSVSLRIYNGPNYKDSSIGFRLVLSM